MARRRASGIAVSQLQEAIQILPVRSAVGGVDRRSLERSRSILDRLSSYKPSEVAAAMEISTQKYAAIRRGVSSGNISSPELNDFLEQAEKKVSEVPTFRREEYTAEEPDSRRRRIQTTDVWEIPERWRRKNIGWTYDIHPGGFASKRSALNWLGNVGGANEYFQIVRKTLKNGQHRYHVYDIRGRGKKQDAARALRKLERFAAEQQRSRSRGHQKRTRR